MPKSKKTTIEPTHIKGVILQNFSQCAFDILQIVKTVIKYPGEYKELNQKYFDLTQLLERLMGVPDVDLKFKGREYELPWNFIYLPYREEKDRKVLYKAETNLRDLVSRIEQKRKELLGEKYIPNTGIKDSELKAMLEKISGSKNVQPPKINEEDSVETIQNNEKEIQISKTIAKKYKDMKFEFRKKRGMFQLNKSSPWIDLGGHNTRTCKMAEYILSPSSKSKLIDDIYEYIKIQKDLNNEELQENTSRSHQLKRDIIEKAVDELQKEEFLKGHISQPVFGEGGQTAIIKFI